MRNTIMLGLLVLFMTSALLISGAIAASTQQPMNCSTGGSSALLNVSVAALGHPDSNWPTLYFLPFNYPQNPAPLVWQAGLLGQGGLGMPGTATCLQLAPVDSPFYIGLPDS